MDQFINFSVLLSESSHWNSCCNSHTSLLGYLGSPCFWTLVVAILVGAGATSFVLIGYAVVMLIFNLKPLRQLLVSKALLNLMKGFMPKISETERTALEAGVVWVEKDLFSGAPDFKKILAEPYPDLTAEEQAFLDGPTEKLCKMIDPWALWRTREMDAEVWAFMKKERFFGMIIPKEYGGLGFSALAHSAVVMKIGSRSLCACTTIMVPNSLGPAELLIHYGTDAQKKHYLPRLARGRYSCLVLQSPRLDLMQGY